jgi:adenylosuccinate lyase
MLTDRYQHAQIRAVWSPEAKLQRWVMVERAIAMAGEFSDLADTLGQFRVDPWFIQTYLAREMVTGHEVTAFLQALESQLKGTPQINRLHWGATSSDLMDTELALAVRIATTILIEEVKPLFHSPGLRAGTLPHRVARTHGQAVYLAPIVQVLNTSWMEIDRAVSELSNRVGQIPGRIAGPAGDHPILSRHQERNGLAELGLESDLSGTQLVSRDRLVSWLDAISGLVTAYQKLATLIRFEAIEGVDGVTLVRPSAQYTGSSAMPHKVNPTRAERICGLAGLVRANVRAVQDASISWGDHSLEHSSVERMVIPMVTELAGFLTVETINLLVEVTWQLKDRMPPGSYDSFRELHQRLEDQPDKLRSQVYAEMVRDEMERAHG